MVDTLPAPRAQDAPTSTGRPESRLGGVLIAVAAVAAVSTSAVLVRLAGSVTAYEIALWRLVVASAVLAPPMVASGAWPLVRLTGLRRFALYGAILATHFIAYNLALANAPIAHVLPLAYTSTIFVAILSAMVLKEPLRRHQVLGILVVLAGLAVLAGLDVRVGGRVLLGDAFAVVAAVAFALYSLVGRRERNRLPLLGYAVGVYALAAVWAAPFALARSHGGYTLTAILALVALGIVPNAVGHTLYNASLRRINATVANVLLTQEVIGAILLGWLVLGERPALHAIVGAGIMLIGIITVLL